MSVDANLVELAVRAVALSPLPTVYLGRDGRLLGANPAYCAFLGYSESEITSVGIVENSRPEDLPRQREAIERMLAGDIDTWATEKEFIRKDGSRIWGHLQARILRSGVEDAPCFIVFVEDITARKRHESDLAKTNLRLELALAARRLTVWDINLVTEDVTIRYSPSRTHKQVTRTNAEFIQQLHPDDRARIAAALARLKQEGSAFKEEFRLLFQDGSLQWLQAVAQVMRDEKTGLPARAFGTAMDITSEKLRDNELAASAGLLRFTLDAMPTLVAYLDSNLQYKFTNSTYEAWFGSHIPNIKGGRLAASFGEDFAATVAAERRRALTGKVTHCQLKITLDGEVKDLDLRYIPHYATTSSGQGAVIGIMMVAEDITARVQLQQRIDERRSALVASAKLASLGEMAGGVAHEINNPLTVILGRTRQLARAVAKDSLEPGRLVEGLQVIETMGARVAKIVASLKTFSRDGTHDPAQTALVSEIIEETETLCRERFKTHGIALDINQAAGGLRLHCRPVQISQVLANLLMNAFDAVEPLAERWVRVDVTVSADGDWCRIAVTDAGSGIDAAVVPNIFNPFFTTKEVGKGTGLGLSISTSIARDHGGSLSLDPQAVNTCFVLTLPLAVAAKGVA